MQRTKEFSSYFLTFIRLHIRCLTIVLLILIFGFANLINPKISYAASIQPDVPLIPNVTCTTTPNYTIYEKYSSILGPEIALRVGWENAAKTSGFGYCHILAEHGTAPLAVIAYVLDNGTVIDKGTNNITLRANWPFDNKNYVVYIVTGPILSDGYSKGIITAYQGDK